MQSKYLLVIGLLFAGVFGFWFWPEAVDTSQYAASQTSTDRGGSMALMQNKVSKLTSIPTAPQSTRLLESSQASLQQVALLHQQSLQYPSYSQPITDAHSPYLSWNDFDSVETPVLDGKVTASLSLAKYRYFFPEVIEVELRSQAASTTAQLDIVSVETQSVLQSHVSDDGQWGIVPNQSWPQEIRLIARVDFEQGQDVVSADIRLYHSVASVSDVGEGYAQGPDMKVPMILDVGKAGIYRVRANLYQSGGGAIASLVEKQRLSTGLQNMELKVFKGVLPSGSNALELRDVMIERMSSYPGEKAGYGKSESKAYPVGTFDTDSLSDDAYQMTEQEKQQLTFLQQLL
ncbi:hypothetical protein ACODM8_12350 [Vibrio ostreicida]|uniref:hypothetical protein n=1 Tax=Vibrio ostreicida TaxID=526588 RepID=UPI003B5B40AB